MARVRWARREHPAAYLVVISLLSDSIPQLEGMVAGLGGSQRGLRAPIAAVLQVEHSTLQILGGASFGFGGQPKVLASVNLPHRAIHWTHPGRAGRVFSQHWGANRTPQHRSSLASSREHRSTGAPPPRPSHRKSHYKPTARDISTGVGAITWGLFFIDPRGGFLDDSTERQSCSSRACHSCDRRDIHCGVRFPKISARAVDRGMRDCCRVHRVQYPLCSREPEVASNRRNRDSPRCGRANQLSINSACETHRLLRHVCHHRSDCDNRGSILNGRAARRITPCRCLRRGNIHRRCNSGPCAPAFSRQETSEVNRIGSDARIGDILTCPTDLVPVLVANSRRGDTTDMIATGAGILFAGVGAAVAVAIPEGASFMAEFWATAPLLGLCLPRHAAPFTPAVVTAVDER